MDHEATPGTVGKQRVEALADGIFAIALTLLVLDIKVPVLPEHATDAALAAGLAALVPRALAWILSFWVMGLLWLGQLRTLALLRALSWPMVRVQLLSLACVSLMPFSTALVSEHGRQALAVAVYATNLLAIALLSLLFTHLVLRRPALHVGPIPEADARRLYVRGAVTAACALAALVLGFFVGSWGLLAMAGQLLSPRPRGPRETAVAH